MRVLTLLAAWIFLATFAPPAAPVPVGVPGVSLVRYRALPLDRSWPDRPSVGRLQVLGAWQLSSNDPRFGGLSAMHVEAGEVLAFSDAGWKFRFPVPRGVEGAVRADIGPLPDGPGSEDAKADRDIEAMWAQGNQVWIGFERRNAVWRFNRTSWRVESWAAPAAMHRWSANRGSEAMLRLADGRFLVISEGDERGSDVALFAGDPAVPDTPAVHLRYRPPPAYRPTDAALLPDGRALVLNRRFGLLNGLTAKLVAVRLDGLRDGATLVGEEIAELRAPLNVDNMEALSVSREGGRTIVWLASDDDYVPLQRTLLMKFALPD